MLLDEQRMALGLGPVLLPLTRSALARLSDVLINVARSWERYEKEGRVYINCDRLVLRLTREEFLELMSLVSRAMTWLQGQSQELPN